MTTTTTTYRVAVLGLTWLAGTAGHEVGDYLVQLDRDAQRKQQRGRQGRVSLARHALSYGLTQAVMKAAAYRVGGVRVPLAAQAAGTAVEILAHAVIDDGRLLRRFAVLVGKLRFHDLAAAGIDGRALLDQACHRGLQVPLGAVITTALATRAGRH